MRVPLYQVMLDPDPSWYSPSGDHIRFNFSAQDGEPQGELHGWYSVDSIVVDTLLSEYVDGEWREPEYYKGCVVKLSRTQQKLIENV
ncbi:hypothetical protein OAA60_00625 [Porticoccaceae bacterium]|nr:hypothetical protein [Porticoccaceae bacterium]